MSDREILRALARTYAEQAADPRNKENEKLYRAVNGLRMIRPVVLIDEEPWSELIQDGDLALRCADADFRAAESFLRRMLYKWRHHPADMILPPYLPVHKIVGGKSGWLPVREDTIATDAGNNIVSHKYEDQLQRPEDIDRLEIPRLTYEREATERIRDKLAGAVGDLLPVRLTGHHSYISPWDQISTYRGVTSLFMDLYDRPEHMHAIMEKMTQMYIAQNRQFEALGLWEAEPCLLHCTAGLCDEIFTPEGQRVLSKNAWGRGMAQIFASVSEKMHEEFDIAYQRHIMEDFGLCYYGCCEPLDKKLTIIEKLPRLRKISITPWADAKVAAEAVGKRYVLSLKPNPANVGAGFDIEVIKKEIKSLLDACYKNGCSCDLVLKDISTVHHNPEHLRLWERAATQIARSY